MKQGGDNITSRVKIGAMDERVTLRQYVETLNDYGEQTLTWSNLATVWAAVEYPKTGSEERVSSAQPTAFQTLFFRIRYRSDVEPKMRVQYGSDELDIISVSVIGRKQHLMIEAEKRQ